MQYQQQVRPYHNTHLSLIKYFLIICLVFFTACFENNSISHKQLIDTSQVAILHVEKLNDYFSPLDSLLVAQSDTASFNLTDSDLVTINSVLEQSIQEYNSMVDTTNPMQAFLELNRYKKQYVPYFDKQDHKKVWINCFCHEALQEFFLEEDTAFLWKSRIINAIDGGSCFFNLLIDLTTKQKLFFKVNSPG